MITIELTQTMFHDLMNSRNAGAFSYDALDKLYDYYDELDTNDFDPVATNCEWDEYADYDSLYSDYGYLIDDEEVKMECPSYDEDTEDVDQDELEAAMVEAILDELEKHTIIYRLPSGGVLVRNF